MIRLLDAESFHSSNNRTLTNVSFTIFLNKTRNSENHWNFTLFPSFKVLNRFGTIIELTNTFIKIVHKLYKKLRNRINGKSLKFCSNEGIFSLKNFVYLFQSRACFYQKHTIFSLTYWSKDSIVVERFQFYNYVI